MHDQEKTKEQLISELKELREELALFKALGSENIQIVSVLRDFKGIYNSFYKSNPHPMWIYDLETLAFLDVNNAAIKHYGYSQEEFLSMTIKHIRPPEDIPALLNNIAKVTKGLDRAGIWRHIKKDGTLIYVEIISHTMTFAGRRAEIVLAFDITEQKRAEEEIKNTISLLIATLESTADGILVVDRQGKIVSFNQKFLEMWNIPQQIVESRNDNQALSFVLNQLENPQGFMNKVIELYARPENESYDVLEFKDGKVFERYSQPKRTGEVITGRVWSFRNVTERKRAEESLQASEERFRALTESTSDWIWEIDQYGVYSYTSPKVKDLLGYDPEEIIGKKPSDLMPEDETKRISEIFNSIMESRKPFAALENKNLHKDGREVILETSGVPIIDKDGNFTGYRGIDRDITERNKAEESLKASEKELKKRVKDLEEFYNIAVGRELRMKKLKEEIETLKKELGKYKKQ
jgi:PAS domain S-box-containing protein